MTEISAENKTADKLNNPSEPLPCAEHSYIYYLIDCCFWLFDETCRWLKIGSIAEELHRLKAAKRAFQNKYGLENGAVALEAVSEQDRCKILGFDAKIMQLSAESERLKSQCWAVVPELLFAVLFAFYVCSIIFMSPVKRILHPNLASLASLDGQLKSVRRLRVRPVHSVITKAAWYGGRLFVGGDGGLSVIDTASGSVVLADGLPDDFFVRDLCIHNGELYIGGYGGVYKLSNTTVLPVYTGKSLPVKLVNSLAVTDDNEVLIGTIGTGVMLGKKNSAVRLLGTKGTVNGFARQQKDLWVLYENAVYMGRGSDFKPQNPQSLAGRHLRCLAAADTYAYIGTDHSVAAYHKYKNLREWEQIPVGKPSFINDLAISGDSLFIASKEGTFRFLRHRPPEKLSSEPALALCVCGSFLASINEKSVSLFYFSGEAANNGGACAFMPKNNNDAQKAKPGISVLPLSGIQAGRLPDFKQFLQNENALELAKTKAFSETIEVNKRPFVPIPAELQSPVFTSVVQIEGGFVLASKNRGIWLYNGKSWVNANSAPNLGLERLAYNKSSCYAYGEEAGIYQIINGECVKHAPPQGLKGLASMYADSSNELLLLYKNGVVKGFKEGVLYNLFAVPHELAGEFKYIYKLNEKLIVVANQGVMLLDKASQWQKLCFNGTLENARVVSAAQGGDSTLFIALDNGKIYKYANERLELAGVVDDIPVSVNYSGCLWVACKNCVFFMENKNFIKTPFRSDDKVIGVFPVPESEAYLVFTDKGILPGRAQN